jgi:hypothetical protein
LEEEKIKKLLVLVLVLAFVGAVQADLIQNPGFESGFNGWTVWTWGDGSAAISTDAYAGTASADFGTVASWGWGGGAGAFQGVFIGEGIPVSISAYAKGVSGMGIAGIDMIFLGPDWAIQNPDVIGRADLAVANFGAADETGWRFGLLNAVTPAGTMFVRFEVNNNGDPGHILFDNVGIPEQATCMFVLAGDLNDDCKADFGDLSILADQWLQPPSTPSADIAPSPNGDGIVNFQDFAYIASNWLIDCDTNPSNPACVPK